MSAPYNCRYHYHGHANKFGHGGLPTSLVPAAARAGHRTGVTVTRGRSGRQVPREPDDAIADLRQRTAAACLPTKELVDDRSQGVQLATITELARYWTTDYDWR